MKFYKFVPWLTVIVLFIFFQYLSLGVNHIRVSFPGVQKGFSDCNIPVNNLPVSDELSASGKDVCACTLVSYTSLGFPFSINLYDVCGQDASVIWWIQSINWVLQVVILAPTFFLTKKLAERKHKNTA